MLLMYCDSESFFFDRKQLMNETQLVTSFTESKTCRLSMISKSWKLEIVGIFHQGNDTSPFVYVTPIHYVRF